MSRPFTERSVFECQRAVLSGLMLAVRMTLATVGIAWPETFRTSGELGATLIPKIAKRALIGGGGDMAQ